MNRLAGLQAIGQQQGALHLAIGVFDGVHLGHQAVIGCALRAASIQRQAGQMARALVVTFEPHPIAFLRPEKAPRMLASLEHKRRLLEQLGVDALVVLAFDQELASLSAAEFIQALFDAGCGRLASISVGSDWRYGARAEGDIALLQRECERRGCALYASERVLVDGQRVSSTRIRAAISTGNFAEAKRLLGRNYRVLGTVIEGKKLGRELGFPTANLQVHSEQLPPSGVYFVEVFFSESERVFGAANLGLNPTTDFGLLQRKLEVFLFDFDREIYGEDLEVEFVEFLREEQSFASIDALKQQISADVARARMLARALASDLQRAESSQES